MIRPPPDQLSPAVFLDRDGTIMRDVNYGSNPTQVEIFSGVPEALVRLKQNGYKPHHHFQSKRNRPRLL